MKLRNWALRRWLWGIAASSTLAAAAQQTVLTLHPENSRYFLYGRRPAVLVTSAEHYGALLNLDFDFKVYLETLQAGGLNLTRVFSGAYVEPPGAFNIARNTLAPAEGRFVCPWARSEESGYAGGGNRFDLNRWDESYFDRLKALVRTAADCGVIVEYVFFCPFYDEAQWNLSPQNSKNNVNGLGTVGREEVYTLDCNGGLLAVHEALVRKVAQELNEFGNLYYEICNEPYFGGVTMEWQHRIADVIVEAEREAPVRHLISQNIANGKARVMDPHPAISIFNFHYASPPDTVALNWDLERVLGDNETGFKGVGDRHYRMEGWEFLLAGGALFNHLDYSFCAGHEDGTFDYPDSQPGGGSVALRNQLGALKRFVESFPLLRMRPMPQIVRGGVPEGERAQVLGAPEVGYALYLTGGAPVELEVEIPAGKYGLEWFDPLEARAAASEAKEHDGGILTLAVPAMREDAALALRKVD
ncbi:MAG TPA: hypothetical protein VMN36_00570 [Verrucomicrobiales bacterium]|nr:hypothetical protein [Verrucomicrobiales bacterium]